MYGVSEIHSEPNITLITFPDAAFLTDSLARHLQVFADHGIVVDMISQSAPHGTTIDFSFTAGDQYFPAVMKALQAAHLSKDAPAPRICGGFSKINLYGQDMVTSCGVAARALKALAEAGIEVHLITTSDLDISLLVGSENEDMAQQVLRAAFAL